MKTRLAQALLVLIVVLLVGLNLLAVLAVVHNSELEDRVRAIELRLDAAQV